MQPVQTRLAFDWMRASALKMLLLAFSSQASEIYFAGGCVRDSLLNRPVNDIDLATPLTPGQVVACLQQHGIHYIEIGRKFGTIIARIEGKNFEITTFRRDIETDGRWAKVDFTTRMHEDAARRDFTINALYLSPQGDLYDFFDGQNHLQKGQLQFIGNPADRIQEDYLRILRFFRFYAFYGRQEPTAEALEACQTYAAQLEKISGERIKYEFSRLLAAPSPLAALTLMAKTSLAEKAFQTPLNLHPFKHLLQFEDVLKMPASPLLRLYILFQQDWTRIAERFAFSSKEKNLWKNFARYPEEQNQTVYEWLYFYGNTVAQAFIILKALDKGFNDHLISDWKITLNWNRPLFPLNGEDALKAGLNGKAVGATLREIERWWAANEFRPTREQCIEKLAARADRAIAMDSHECP